MSTMKYYYRYDKANSCEVICTRCFAKLGTATELTVIRQMEARHVCGRNAGGEQSGSLRDVLFGEETSGAAKHLIQGFIGLPREVRWSRMIAVFACVAALLYGLPTAGELLAARHWNPWFAIILPGDLLGCVCMGVIFRMYRAGFLLYLVLTAAEGFLYLSHALGKNALPWIVDIVPMFVVATLILRLGLRVPHRRISFS